MYNAFEVYGLKPRHFASFKGSQVVWHICIGLVEICFSVVLKTVDLLSWVYFKVIRL